MDKASKPWARVRPTAKVNPSEGTKGFMVFQGMQRGGRKEGQWVEDAFYSAHRMTASIAEHEPRRGNDLE